MNQVSDISSTQSALLACERGDLSELQCVLEESQLDIGSEPLDSKGQTALHIACGNGHLHIAQYLVNDKECSVMVEDVYGHAPFVLSLINKHWKVANFLLTAAPSSDTFKKHIGLLCYGESLVAEVTSEALIVSCNRGYFQLVKFLIKYKRDYKYTYLRGIRESARSNGYLHIVQLLLKYCKCTEPARDLSLSEIHVACILGDGEKVTAALASNGATVLSNTDWYRMNPLHYASCEPKILSMTIGVITKENTALFNSKDRFGNTPLHYAVLAGCIESVSLLIKAPGCNVNLVNVKGETPVHLACRQSDNNVAILQMLATEQTCDLNVQNNIGDTVLHTTVKERMQVKYIKELTFHKSCNPSIANHDGMTPLQLALNTDQVSTIEVLLQCVSAKCSQKDMAKAIQDLLHRAMHAEKIVLFMMLIQKFGFNINEVNHDGKTPLHVACTLKNMKYIQTLIQQLTCSLNIQDYSGDTALHIAACNEFESTEKIQCILECDRCDPNITNKLGYTPLYSATVNNKFDSVKMLLNSTKCNPNIQDLQGNTALHMSIHQKSAAGIEPFLMCDNVDVNIQNKKRNTPLHVAVIRETVVYVIKKIIGHPNCNPSITNHEGMTPLQLAFKTDQLSAIEVLLLSERFSHADIAKAMQESPCLLHRVIHADMMSLLMILIEIKMCNVNEVNHYGQTPLHVACTVNKMEYIQALTQHPTCNLNIQDSIGDTALHLAIYNRFNSAEKIQCILNSGRCDPNITNKQGYTPLHKATVNNQFYSVRILLKSTKCNPNIQDLQGNTALHLCIDQKSTTGIELFLMCDNVDVNIQNKYGDTPLHVALTRAIPVGVVEALVHHSHCTVSKANVEAMTPLQLSARIKRLPVVNIIAKKSSLEDISDLLYNQQAAVLENRPDLVHTLFETLLENGANVQTMDRSGNAPIHIVCKSLKLDCLIALLQSKKFDPNQQNADGDTPLHIVCKMGNIDKIEILLKNRANVQAVDSNGDAPIHIVCKILRLDILKVLLCSKACDPNQRNADGNTPLHIVCKMTQNIFDSHMNFVQALISTPGIDPEVANHAGLTPVEVAGSKYFSIQTINNFLKQKQSFIQTYLKIFIVGNSGTGKSTLIKAVTAEASQLLKYAIFPKKKHVNPSDVSPLTAGIVPIPFNSKHFGHAVLYDFAGQHEYYSSHAAVMENLILPSPPLFLLLIDISKPIEKIKEELVYWWQFINNHSQRAAAPPHVIFVASHKDIVRARGEAPQIIIDEIMESSISDIKVSFKFEGSFPLDCRKLVSRGLAALLAKLNSTCQILRQTADIDLHCHILKSLLTSTDFQALISCELSLILKKFQTENAVLLPSEPSQLIPLLSALNDKGHILFLQNHTDVNKSWVILKPEVLLAEVNGSIFAPEYFKEHSKDFAMSTGVVALSKIREKFTDLNHEVIVEFLIHLEFCFRIKDKHTLEMITKNEVSLTNQASEYREEYYFFPALVRNKNPADVCQPQETDMYRCGWFYKCGKEREQLTTRFLHVLILRLAFSCEPPDDPTERESVVLLRSCSVWKHGIAWWTDDGIETIVEVGLQCRWVTVMMRCPDTHKVQCAELRSKVIKIVLKAKQDFCPVITTMHEFLIAPSSLQYPFEGRELILYSMRKIASIVVEGKDFAKDIEGKKPIGVHQLLPFEPYRKLEDLISHFFNEDQSMNTEVSSKYLEQIAKKCYENLDNFKRALQTDPIEYEKECSRTGDSQVSRCVALFQILQRRGCKTWRDFEREFSRFSIFCGRDPMEIAGRLLECGVPLETQDPQHHSLVSDSDQTLGDAERAQGEHTPGSSARRKRGAVKQSVTESEKQFQSPPTPPSKPVQSQNTQYHISKDDNKAQTGTDITAAIDHHIGKLTATISLDLTHFSNQFIESGFMTQDATNDILTKLGVSNKEKARQLLHLVTANYRIALDNQEWADKFIAVFSSITSYQSLAATLTRETYPPDTAELGVRKSDEQSQSVLAANLEESEDRVPHGSKDEEKDQAGTQAVTESEEERQSESSPLSSNQQDSQETPHTSGDTATGAPKLDAQKSEEQSKSTPSSHQQESQGTLDISGDIEAGAVVQRIAQSLTKEQTPFSNMKERHQTMHVAGYAEMEEQSQSELTPLSSKKQETPHTSGDAVAGDAKLGVMESEEQNKALTPSSSQQESQGTQYVSGDDETGEQSVAVSKERELTLLSNHNKRKFHPPSNSTFCIVSSIILFCVLLCVCLVCYLSVPVMIVILLFLFPLSWFIMHFQS